MQIAIPYWNYVGCAALLQGPGVGGLDDEEDAQGAGQSGDRAGGRRRHHASRQLKIHRLMNTYIHIEIGVFKTHTSIVC